jgi:hypothetical protein
MDDKPTCGKGLAANASLPDLFGRLTASTAAILEAHLAMLDVSDPRSATEHAVYVGLMEEHRHAAAVLHAIAERMTGARDLPMGRHLSVPEANSEMGRAFAEFVEGETALRALLDARLVEDRQMLAAMQADASEHHAG